MSIRFKVILPYLLLTLVIAIAGVYVVTKLVTDTLTERLTNQLLEAGRVVSDEIRRQEVKHMQFGRNAALTIGMSEAVANNDAETVAVISEPIAGGNNIENLIVLNSNGHELVHFIKGTDGAIKKVEAQSGIVTLPLISKFLAEKDPDASPRRQLVSDSFNKYYYLTSLPISLNGKMVGVVVIGTSLDTILPILKNTSLADVIFYKQDGQVIGSTLGKQGTELEQFIAPSITPETYKMVVDSNKNGIVPGENITVTGREYSLARGSLEVGDDLLGVFAVVLPAQFVAQTGTTNRNTYTLIFALTVLGVVIIGYAIANLIIKPLISLVRTSLAIAGGDLTQRSGIRSKDEIGVLATTFDGMTESLQQRTADLEKTNRILEQMDKTKVSFIAISAHELRTPLTLISGYSQLLEQQASSDPNLAPLAKGLLEGANRMTEVVNSMLDVSRIDNQTLKIVPADVEISSIIAQVRSTFETALQDRHLTLTITGIEDLPSIHADPDLLLKVFYHLCVNAIKYTPDGGQITISGRTLTENAESPEIEVVVSDTGIGIATEHRELIFEKFFQIGEVASHSSGKTKFKGGGPGLGLAIARGIVLAHKGRIWVESPGHNEETCPGSKFYVRLPVQPASK